MCLRRFRKVRLITSRWSRHYRLSGRDEAPGFISETTVRLFDALRDGLVEGLNLQQAPQHCGSLYSLAEFLEHERRPQRHHKMEHSLLEEESMPTPVVSFKMSKDERRDKNRPSRRHRSEKCRSVSYREYVLAPPNLHNTGETLMSVSVKRPQEANNPVLKPSCSLASQNHSKVGVTNCQRKGLHENRYADNP